MRLARSPITLFALLCLPFATLTAQAPAGATGKCADGSYTRATQKQGACSHHSGVAEWYAARSASSAKQAASGVNGAKGSSSVKVWVNTPTMVYHCPGARWYGTTKKGSYMTEAAAKAAGARPSNGKSCS